MNARSIILEVVFCSWLTWLTGSSYVFATDVQADFTNIVVVLVDNCGKEWFGCYGSQEKATPNIDRIAAGGARFDTCYTVPICGPSRAMLLSGRYPFRTGWTLHHDAALYGGGGLDPTREVTFARPLRKAGYRTAVVGKWQIDNLYEHPKVLHQHGFDQWCVWPGSIDREKMSDEEFAVFMKAVESRDGDRVLALNRGIESRYWDPVLNIDGRVTRESGAFGPDVFQEYATRFLRENAERPFLLYYPMVLTHGISMKQPVVGVPPHREITGTDREAYREMVRYVDKQIGELASTLDALKLREKTLLIVATDNGTEQQMAANFQGHEIHGGLYSLDEPGVNVPLLFSLPGTIPSGLVGTTSDFTDVFATVCDFAGVKPPEGVTIDGQSHKAFLRGVPNAFAGRDFALAQYHTERVARSGEYKLYSTGKFCRIEHGLIEVPLDKLRLSEVEQAAWSKLTRYLQQIPNDAQLPFARRSITAFQWGVK